MISWFRPKSPVTGLQALFVRFALVCMLALLHVSASKAACYALPLFPILFLMTGVWLEDTAIRWASALDRRMIGLTFGLVGVADGCMGAGNRRGNHLFRVGAPDSGGRRVRRDSALEDIPVWPAG